jgi:hypothetical protein
MGGSDLAYIQDFLQRILCASDHVEDRGGSGRKTLRQMLGILVRGYEVY